MYKKKPKGDEEPKEETAPGGKFKKEGTPGGKFKKEGAPGGKFKKEPPPDEESSEWKMKAAEVAIGLLVFGAGLALAGAALGVPGVLIVAKKAAAGKAVKTAVVLAAAAGASIFLAKKSNSKLHKA